MMRTSFTPSRPPFAPLLGAALLAGLCAAPSALAQSFSQSSAEDLNAAMSQARAASLAADDAAASKPPPHVFGEPGSWWLSLGAAYAHDTGKDTDLEGSLGVSTFLAKDLECRFELGGWYFAQEGPDTAGGSFSILVRWHFWHTDDYDWTTFGEVGIGLLGAADKVPNGGTNFDFLPRITAGFTKRLTDDDVRLEVGVGWHHVSNARFNGSDSNPGRDSLMVFTGVVFPF